MHSKHLLAIWIWLTVYDLRKNIGQDFWIWFYFDKTYRLWPRKDAIFLNTILWKIAGKAVLDDLNGKIFFVSQPWWPTGFLGIYQLSARNLKWPPKSGIIWSRWPPGFKMLFPALRSCLQILDYFNDETVRQRIWAMEMNNLNNRIFPTSS